MARTGIGWEDVVVPAIRGTPDRPVSTDGR
jgi:hypothetical protein